MEQKISRQQKRNEIRKQQKQTDKLKGALQDARNQPLLEIIRRLGEHSEKISKQLDNLGLAFTVLIQFMAANNVIQLDKLQAFEQTFLEQAKQMPLDESTKEPEGENHASD